MNDINAFYAKCFKSYLRQKQLISILQLIGLITYLLLVIICPTLLIMNSVNRFGPKSLLALIFPAIWAAFFALACLSYSRYWRATAELAKGQTTEKIGYITAIHKNNFQIADTLPPENSRKKPAYSKPALFHIPASRRLGDFQPGDKITIIYARSRELNIYNYLHLVAICAFPAAANSNFNQMKGS